MFDALSERDGQLRELIENANRVFATTASRDRELQETFVALPTFERESRETIDRLTEFARDTDPLVTQLRPAARELSPTLQDLVRPRAGPRVAVPRPRPADRRPRRPASRPLEKVLQELPPLLGQLDPALRQVNPVLDALGFYKPELTAFLANTVAATQATSVSEGGPLHYLRTTNPLNPENLAVYNTRLPTNRPNPYTLPGTFNQLRTGLPSFETRQCTGGNIPTIDNTPTAGPAGAAAPALDPDHRPAVHARPGRQQRRVLLPAGAGRTRSSASPSRAGWATRASPRRAASRGRSRCRARSRSTRT